MKCTECGKPAGFMMSVCPDCIRRGIETAKAEVNAGTLATRPAAPPLSRSKAALAILLICAIALGVTVEFAAYNPRGRPVESYRSVSSAPLPKPLESRASGAGQYVCTIGTMPPPNTYSMTLDHDGTGSEFQPLTDGSIDTVQVRWWGGHGLLVINGQTWWVAQDGGLFSPPLSNCVRQ